jgi:glycosyltransferase involved in cell wall biosynthesis
VADVARALQKMIEAPDLRQTMGVAAGQRARDYAWSGKAQRIVETYRSLLSEQPRQGVSQGSVA